MRSAPEAKVKAWERSMLHATCLLATITSPAKLQTAGDATQKAREGCNRGGFSVEPPGKLVAPHTDERLDDSSGDVCG